MKIRAVKLDFLHDHVLAQDKFQEGKFGHDGRKFDDQRRVKVIVRDEHGILNDDDVGKIYAIYPTSSRSLIRVLAASTNFVLFKPSRILKMMETTRTNRTRIIAYQDKTLLRNSGK